MLRESKKVVIGLTLVISLLFHMKQISGQSFESMIYPLSAKAEFVKEIKEKKQKWTTYYFHDTNGLLIRQVNYFKKQKRADYQFEYIITDTILIVKEIYEARHTIKKFHYDSNGKVSKFEIFSDRNTEYPFVLGYNFVYKDNLLTSFDWSNARPDTIFPPRKTKYIYDNNRRVVVKQEINQYNFKDAPLQVDTTFYTYRYDSKGHLTDQVVETTNKEAVYSGVPLWSREQTNKYHLIFTDYDRHGQWRISYYLTKNSKKFRSNRKIKYWK